MQKALYNREKLRADFLKDGFVVRKGFFDRAEVDAVQQNLARCINDVIPTMPPGHAMYENKDDKTTLKQLELSAHDPYFRDLLNAGPFVEVAADALGGPVEGKSLQYFNKPPLIGQATPPHQDGYYFMLTPPEAVTMWLALDNVDEENGCIRYIRGSHRLGMRPHSRSNTVGFSQGMSDFGTEGDKRNEVLIPAAAGDLLIHHALTIHRAEGNRSRTRHRPAIGLVYYSAAAREDTAALAAYRAKLRSELMAAGKV
jgi:phytanoyl-CoA hydroxylase